MTNNTTPATCPVWRAIAHRFADSIAKKIVTRSGRKIDHLRDELRKEAEAALGLWIGLRQTRASRLGFTLDIVSIFKTRPFTAWPKGVWSFAVRTVLFRSATVPAGRVSAPRFWGAGSIQSLFMPQDARGPVDREFRALWIDVTCDRLRSGLSARVAYTGGPLAERARQRWQTFIADLRRLGLQSVNGPTHEARKEAEAVLAGMACELRTLRAYVAGRPPRAKRRRMHRNANYRQALRARNRAEAKRAKEARRLARPPRVEVQVIVPPVEMPPVAVFPSPPMLPTSLVEIGNRFADHVARHHLMMTGTWSSGAGHRQTIVEAARGALLHWLAVRAARLPGADLIACLLARATRAEAASVHVFTFWPATLHRDVRKAVQCVKTPAKIVQTLELRAA